LILITKFKEGSTPMYGKGGAVTTVLGSTAVAVLPNTGGLRPLFIAALAVTALGVITLVVSSVVALKQRG
jgi:hypothetical protein